MKTSMFIPSRGFQDHTLFGPPINHTLKFCFHNQAQRENIRHKYPSLLPKSA